MGRRLGALVGCAIALGLMSGCGWVDLDVQQRAATPGGAGGFVDRIRPDERRSARPVQGGGVSGGRVNSADHSGQVIVFNVWGSWCPPCRSEAPALRQVAEDTAAQGVQFIGINIEDTRAAAQAFERRYEIPYPSIFDPDGKRPLAFRRWVPPAAVPSTVVLDRRGRVAARIIGRTTYPKLRDAVDGVLGEDGGAGASRTATTS